MQAEKLFDLSEEYDAMLNRGLQLSGESKDYFIAGRIRQLIKSLPGDFKASRILDYGCGIGDAAKAMGDFFPDAAITGSDLSENALEHAKTRYANSRINFIHLSEIRNDTYDLVYVNGVFHHIPPSLRDSAVSQVFSALKSGAFFAFFENNPWNPGARLVMSRIPFDRDAKMLSCLEAKRLLLRNGFSTPCGARFLFYFPKRLKLLRFLEEPLGLLPLGAQYLILAARI